MEMQKNYNQQPKSGLSLAGDNSRSNNTYSANTHREKTPEDWKKNRINPEPELDVFVTSEVHGKAINTTGRRRLIASHIFVWIAAIAWTVICIKNIYTGFTDLSVLDSGFLVSAIVMMVCCVIFTIDALLLNHLYQKNVFLIIFSWILNFVYISRRALFVQYKRSVLAFIMSVVMFISTAGCGYVVYRFCDEYSLVLDFNEEEGRDILRHFLAEESGKNGTYGQILGKDFKISGVAVKTAPTGQNIIVLIGNGQYDVKEAAYAESADLLPENENEVFVKQDKKNVRTQLTFIQIGRGMEYHLSSVSINKKMLKSECVYDYWKLASKK